MCNLNRCFIWLTLGLAACLCSSASANLVINGDFEDDLNNWEWFGIGNNVATTSTDTPSGTGNSADLDIVDFIGLPWLVQDVDISGAASEGEVVTLTASVREVRQFQPDTDAWIASQIFMLESSESGNILASGFAFYTNPEWETQSFDVTVPANANIARILFTPQDPSFGVGTGQYRIDDVSLVVSAGGVPGDYNNNGVVDAADYPVWLQALSGGTLENEGSGISPGAVDLEDYTFWKSRLGETSGIGSSQSVSIPEPSSCVLVLLMSANLFLSRRRTQ